MLTAVRLLTLSAVLSAIPAAAMSIHAPLKAKPYNEGAKPLRPVKYMFAISTGHVGTTSLSSPNSYDDAEHIKFLHEEYISASRDDWQRWWDSKPDQYHKLQAAKYYRKKIDALLKEENKTVFVDLGHHILEGIHDRLADVFGTEEMVILRLRRNRRHVVHSFEEAHPDKGLCDMSLRLCPLTNDVRLHPRGSAWHAAAWENLTSSQQLFWFIDEVEAQWQTLVNMHRNLRYLECNWHDEMTPCLEAVAKSLGIQVQGQGKHVQPHVHDTVEQKREADTRLMKEDAEYQEKMQYDISTQRMIQAAQF